MKNIKYVGTSDRRLISEEDFARIGTEADGLAFNAGEVIEVKNEIAETLIDHPTFLGEFEEITDKDLKAEVKAQEEADAEQARLEAEAAEVAAGNTSKGSKNKQDELPGT